jgi:hypothetical protein
MYVRKSASLQLVAAQVQIPYLVVGAGGHGLHAMAKAFRSRLICHGSCPYTRVSRPKLGSRARIRPAARNQCVTRR